MGRNPGYLGKVTLGANTVAYMGKWQVSGAGNEILDGTALADTFEKFDYGVGKGGTITFDGHYDPTDTNGQTVLEAAFIAKTELTAASHDLRLYYNATHYLKGYTGTKWLCESFERSVDRSGIGSVSFTLRVSDGYMVKDS